MAKERSALPRIVILGAGLGGTIAAYELKAAVKGRASVSVVSDSAVFSFLPSNPWVAVGWREADEVQVELAPIFARKEIDFTSVGAKRVHPQENRIELNDGTSIAYDYLVIATGPELAYDQIEGLGPDGGHTVSICQTDHAKAAAGAFESFAANPGPIVVGAVQGASCFGPAYEFAMILDTELRRRKIRDKVPMTFVTSEPYIGHLGLDGVGDTKTMIESAFRDRHIKWITNAKVAKIEAGTMHVEEVGEDGAVQRGHDLPFGFAMMLPSFRGIPAVMDIPGLVNPKGFVIIDKHQRNPAYGNVFGLGVCVAIAPTGPTPVPVGVPKTGFMIESMVTAITANISNMLDGKEPTTEATWNAVCLADFGDDGFVFVAQPQIPPRNVNWSAQGRWVHYAKIAFEKYFLRKIRKGESEPFYERLALEAMGLRKLKITKTDQDSVED